MPLDLSESDKILIDSKPYDLNDVDKKRRKTLMQRVYQQKYRDNIKDSIGIDNFKKLKAVEAKVYRAEVKANAPEKVKKVKPDKINYVVVIDNPVQVVKTPIIKKDKLHPIIPIADRLPDIDIKSFDTAFKTVPAWYKRLIEVAPNFKVNDKNYIDYRAYDEKTIKSIITQITNVIQFQKLTMSDKLIEIITSILRGYNIEHGKYKINVDIFKKELPFLDNIKTLSVFINNLQLYYNNIRTVGNKLGSIVSLISRIDFYENSYQFLTKYCSYIKIIYNDNRNDNIVNDNDIEKITVMNDNWNYKNVDKTNNLIQNSFLNVREQAISSLYLLMPPRRLEWVFMLIGDKNTKIYDRFNYIILDDNDIPDKFIFNNYKSAKSGGKIKKEVMGRQDFDIEDAVKPYLLQYIDKYNLKIGNYLFSLIRTPDTPVSKSDFTKTIENIMKKIFNVKKITANTLRIGGAMYNNAGDKSINEKQKVAKEMGHSGKVNEQYNKILKKEEPVVLVKKVLVPVLKIGKMRSNKRRGKKY